MSAFIFHDTKKNLQIFQYMLLIVGCIVLTVMFVNEKMIDHFIPLDYEPHNSLQDFPDHCIDIGEVAPIITGISSFSGTIGTNIIITGCNLTGFESDKNIWIENSKGKKGLMQSEIGSSSNKILLTLVSPLCQQDASYSGYPCYARIALVPGKYKIFIGEGGKESRKVHFTIY